MDNIAEVTNRADKILRHKCDDRCKIHIGPGNSVKDFACRKMHSVRDCPDHNRHSYVPIKYKFQKTTLDLLQDIGMYEPPTTTVRDESYFQDDINQESGLVSNSPQDTQQGKFTHPYFEPKRHIAPCNFNATCNMSPVILDFFVALKSMQNAQALDHTNGISKYICKYIGKFDNGNYIILCEDSHTGEWVLGKTRLHNTKIVTSKINEDKAFNNDRNKNHPKGRDMPHLEI